MKPLIHIHQVLCRVAPKLTLRIDDLQINAGEHWCLFGPNGSGTSLLAALIKGRLTAGRERVSYAPHFDPQHDLLEVSFEEQQRLWEYDNRRDISDYDPSAIDTGTTVRMLVCGDDPAAEDATLQPLLAEFGIEHLAERGIRYLSSGQMRRAMLARALYRNPRVLILDNPLESIDGQTAHIIVSALEAWMNEDNVLLLLARRQTGIVPRLTHMALMHEEASDRNGRWQRELSLQQAGPLPGVVASADFRALAERAIVVPAALPPPCQGREPALLDRDVPLVELAGVDLAYGERILVSDFHWQMHAGDHVLIEGPNGSGKSTLLALINGENHKAYGQPVRLFGRQRGSGESVWQVKSRFGIVSNDLHQRYIKGWRVLDVVVSGLFDSLGLYDDSGASEHSCARAWLRVMQLEHAERAWYHELSFGHQRLVLLARAMVKHPAILILDEPCTGLDDFHCHLLLALLDRIASDGDTHIMFVSHTEGDVPSCINRVLRFDSRGHIEVDPD